MSMSDSEMKNNFEFDLYKSILNDLFTNWADSHVELQFTQLDLVAEYKSSLELKIVSEFKSVLFF